jgi:hypothetical protein
MLVNSVLPTRSRAKQSARRAQTASTLASMAAQQWRSDGAPADVTTHPTSSKAAKSAAALDDFQSRQEKPVTFSHDGRDAGWPEYGRRLASAVTKSQGNGRGL